MIIQQEGQGFTEHKFYNGTETCLFDRRGSINRDSFVQQGNMPEPNGTPRSNGYEKVEPIIPLVDFNPIRRGDIEHDHSALIDKMIEDRKRQAEIDRVAHQAGVQPAPRSNF